MSGEPIARGPLRRGDLRFRHFRGDLPAITDGFALAAHGCEVEPLVCGNEVGRDRTSDGIFDAELEQRVAGGVRLPERSAFYSREFITSHVDLPYARAPSLEASRDPRSSCISPLETRQSSSGDFKDRLRRAMNEV